MPALADRLADLPRLVEAGLDRQRVPGASPAVELALETFEFAAGTLNRETGGEAGGRSAPRGLKLRN